MCSTSKCKERSVWILTPPKYRVLTFSFAFTCLVEHLIRLYPIKYALEFAWCSCITSAFDLWLYSAAFLH
ncbi:hypothetical protein EDC96DRAFT_491128 [Choanephora cucurbitarum]|nr:hypothetical protein EDC96DRAFT_491128 [Choanephora cucurbitarum]